MTAPAHPVVFRPIIRLLREAGHEVEVTARDYAQNIALLRRMGMDHTVVGPGHGGASRLGKVRALAGRTRAMRHFASGRRFDLAAAHGSNDLALAAASLHIPAVNTFDYEFAVQQHNIGCRLARRVMTPDAIPPERLERYGVGPDKLVQYAGLKEEYYLSDFVPDPGEFDRLGVDREKVVVIVRPPPEVSLYHRKSNQLFPRVLERLGRNEDVSAVVIPRTLAQREHLLSAGLPSVIVPADAVDAQSLIALADLAVSAGGTMNREAVALGTPVYTTFGGRLGGVDEHLIREGRLRPLTDERAIELVKQHGERHIARRDPAILTEMILGTVARPELATPPSLEPLVERYARMSKTFEPKAVDGVLRVLDVVLAGAALVVCSPLLVLSALALLGSGTRGVLYHGARVGRGGTIFTMLKFRTLKPEAEARIGRYSGIELTRMTADEQTRVGHILRATKLDELPQLWNVLRGEMSIVGPRPIRPRFFEELARDIPGYWQRLVVRPGITGFAQLRLTRDMTWAKKLAHDFEYIADRGVRLYVEIVAETAWLVISGRAPRDVP